jgi:hypothetical protein
MARSALRPGFLSSAVALSRTIETVSFVTHLRLDVCHNVTWHLWHVSYVRNYIGFDVVFTQGFDWHGLCYGLFVAA